MVSMTRALRRIKGNSGAMLSQEYLSDLARRAGCRWRERCLSPAVTIQVFILQILHGNVCCAHAPRLARKKVTRGYIPAPLRGEAFPADFVTHPRGDEPVAATVDILAMMW